MDRFNFSTANLRSVFAEEGKYDNFRALCRKVNAGEKIYEYDENGNERVMSKREANRAIRNVLMEVCGLNEETVKSAKKRKRTIDSHINELFELIEEDIDFKVNEGFQESEWFQEFVEYRNLALGDDEEYWTTDNVMMVVAEISGDHHDLTFQNLNEGTPERIHTRHYGAKVGKDIDLILLGRVDFTDLTDHIAEAFAYKIQELCYAAVYGAAAKLPAASQFKKTGNISKAVFDQLIEDVEIANRTSVVIMGTKTALKTLNAYSDATWRAESQKESVAQTGRMGTYEGTRMIEIPQRFEMNTTAKKLFDDSMLLIVPMGQEKFVKCTDVGETEIIQRGQEKADLFDDFRTYEVQRAFGVAAMLGNYFGMVSAT